MKRDWEVVRQILLRLEALGDTEGVLNANEIPGFDEHNVIYQMAILQEAGLIEADVVLGEEGFGMATRLTWNGHELLQHMRDQGMWNNVKKLIREKGVDVSIDAIKLAGGVVLHRLFKGG